MRFVPYSPAFWPWVAGNIKIRQAPDLHGIIALDENGSIAGAIVGERWLPASCVAHIALPNPMSIRRGLIEEWYRYVFETADRDMMLGEIRSDYPKSLNLVRRLGWRELYRLTDGYEKGVDLLYMQYTREQWLGRRDSRWAA